MSSDPTKFGWIGVDFDATLATYEAWVGVDHAGGPIAPMVERVKRWRAEGREVRIFTARVYPLLIVRPEDDLALTPRVEHPFGCESAQVAVKTVQDWCRTHLGEVLTVTCMKDYGMIELWDDRCVQVQPNTGIPIGASSRGLS